jgi:sugar/nucleoside kinase (ribokinase family)
MPDLVPVRPVDYLVIGHLSLDTTPEGLAPGGTAAYASLTARALGLRVGLVTSTGPGCDVSLLDGLQLRSVPAQATTAFENVYSTDGRQQWLHARAAEIGPDHIPRAWRSAAIVHLGPIAAEVDPALADQFAGALVGVTPQGWMRAWDEQGRVRQQPWRPAPAVLNAAGAVVLSLEDLQGDEVAVEELAQLFRLLVVTDAAHGARVYWNRDLRHVPAPAVTEVDPTGAGDVFAAAFFIRMHQTRDPWEAARFANALASASVTRRGIAGVPTPAEIESAGLQVLP